MTKYAANPVWMVEVRLFLLSKRVALSVSVLQLA